MSKYIVVEFEDDAQADKFVKKTDDHNYQGAPYRIAGIFQRPNAWCGCPFQINGENRPLYQGKKFGWWICGWCKKPRPGIQHLRNLLSWHDMVNSIHNRRFEYELDHLSVGERPNRNETI